MKRSLFAAAFALLAVLTLAAAASSTLPSTDGACCGGSCSPGPACCAK